MTEEPDHNLLARQALGMDYALRRLNKESAWVNYTSGSHSLPLSTIEEVRNYLCRIWLWFDAAFER